MATEKIARIPVTLWRDPNFVALSERAQWLYLLLRSQRNVSAAGILDLSVRRWSGLANGATPDDVRGSLHELVTAGYAVVDFDLEEVFVSGHIPADANPKQRAGVALAIRAVRSPQVRAAAEREAVERYAEQDQRPGRDSAFARMRVAVYEHAGYQCVKCGWAPDRPDVYDGRYALCEYTLDAAGNPTVRLLELDHIHPESLGGKFTLNNLQALCNSCNASKGARI